MLEQFSGTTTRQIGLFFFIERKVKNMGNEKAPLNDPTCEEIAVKENRKFSQLSSGVSETFFVQNFLNILRKHVV